MPEPLPKHWCFEIHISSKWRNENEERLWNLTTPSRRASINERQVRSWPWIYQYKETVLSFCPFLSIFLKTGIFILSRRLATAAHANGEKLLRLIFFAAISSYLDGKHQHDYIEGRIFLRKYFPDMGVYKIIITASQCRLRGERYRQLSCKKYTSCLFKETCAWDGAKIDM